MQVPCSYLLPSSVVTIGVNHQKSSGTLGCPFPLLLPLFYSVSRAGQFLVFLNQTTSSEMILKTPGVPSSQGTSVGSQLFRREVEGMDWFRSSTRALLADLALTPFCHTVWSWKDVMFLSQFLCLCKRGVITLTYSIVGSFERQINDYKALKKTREM